MGASQFLRDFRRGALIKKNAELRKRILQRQEETKEKSDSVLFKVAGITKYIQWRIYTVPYASIPYM